MSMTSGKIHGKQNLERYIRDTYASFSPRVHIQEKTTTEELHKKSWVDTEVRPLGRDTYRVYVTKKKQSLFAYGHPVLIQRPTKKGWRV